MTGDPERGAYIFNAAGCLGCHTEKGGAALAGGRAFDTPFGIFYSPNITQDRETGIGNWSLSDFDSALRHGRRPDGMPYYPALPYVSYTGMADQDLVDLFTYMKTVPAVGKANLDHDLGFPFNIRIGLYVWQWLFFEEGLGRPKSASSPSDGMERGGYLAEVLGHCGECHTPRSLFGALDRDRAYGGAVLGKDRVPNITPDKDGIAEWSELDLVSFFGLGMLPDGDFVGSEMAEVVENGTSKLTDQDRKALAAWIKALPPVPKVE